MTNDNSSKGPKKFPFIMVNNNYMNYNYYNQPQVNMIPLIAKDEEFRWIMHSHIIDNVLPNKYLISNYGRVWDIVSNQIVEPIVTNNYLQKYIRYNLLHFIDYDEIDYILIPAGKLVAYYFLYFPGCEYLDIKYKNGIMNDNRVCNLEWIIPDNNGVRGKYNTDKLPDDKVNQICQMILNGTSNREISDQTGVDINSIIDIRNYKSYRNITIRYGFDNPDIRNKYKELSNDRLSEDQVHEIVRMKFNGCSIKEISIGVGCTEDQVKNVLYRNGYSHITYQYKMEDLRKPKNDGVKEVIKKPENKKDISVKRPKPSLEQIHEVCRLVELDDGKTSQEIANLTNTTIDTVRHIRRKDIYKDIVSQYNIPNPKSPSKQLSNELLHKICSTYQRFPHMSATAVAKMYNIKQFIAARIKNRQIYTEVSKDYIW